MGIEITLSISGPKIGIKAIKDVMPENICVNIPRNKVTKTTILWFIPYSGP